MSTTLFRSMLKSNLRTLLSFGLGIVLYQWIFIWVYPSIAKSTAMNSLLKSLPQGWVNLIGYQSGISQISDFLAGEFYGLIYVIVMAIYTVMGATKLMAHFIDNGSMAYLLATPVSRMKVAVTQALVLITGVAVIALTCTLGGLLGVHLYVVNSGLNVGHFVEMNIVGALLFLTVAGYCFMFSCLARDERSALGVSAILTLAFYALNAIGTLTHQTAWLKHFSIFSAFNAQDLVHGHGHFSSMSILLTLLTLLSFGIGIAGFRKRQMSL